MAPEVLLESKYGYEADYYSLGVIMYEMILGWRPYTGSREEILI